MYGVQAFGWHTGDAELSSPSPVAEPDAISNSETNPEQPQNNCLIMHHPEEKEQGVYRSSSSLQQTTPT